MTKRVDEKVFCNQCQFFRDYFMESDASCFAEGNKNHKFDWRSRFWKYIRHPKHINKFNDCRWFEEKKYEKRG